MTQEHSATATLTVDETARILKLSRGATYAAISEGRLPSIRIGRRILVPRKALERLLDGGAQIQELRR